MALSANLAVADHNVPTTSRAEGIADPVSRLQVETLDKNAKSYGLTYFNMNDKRQGIVHVIGPEQGATLPGMTVVCGDSHTSTHGAFGALAHGIGTSEVEHVLATQTLLQKKSKAMLVQVDGMLPAGVTAKDIVLAIIGKIGTAGGTGYCIEFGGSAIRALSMEGRMTVCNMAIEAAPAPASSASTTPPSTTSRAVRSRRPVRTGIRPWPTGARCIPTRAPSSTWWSLNAADIKPQVTWGTSPEMVLPVDGRVPDPDHEKTASSAAPSKGAGLHGPEAQHRHRRHPHRQGVHRFLHQLAHRRPARRRRRGARQAARLQRQAGAGGAGLGPGQGAGRARRPGPDLQGRRL
jgi:3-isopropylmalate/(R)-2-methylmalate dehydratase large subunit